MEKKTLKQRMLEDLQLRGFSLHTQKQYLVRVTLFARYFNKLPDKLGEKEVKEYFLHFVNDKHGSYGVLNVTYCALKFIYSVTLGRPWEVAKIPRTKRPVKMPVILDKEERPSAHRRHRKLKAQDHTDVDLLFRLKAQRGGPSQGERRGLCPYGGARPAG
jgi:hypothetical protein